MQKAALNKIIAVIVTYNRLPLLQQTIAAVCGQTRKPDIIIAVNNASDDGTQEWLEAQTGITTINQPNIGGAGGFHTGMQAALDLGAQWIWCMDDDVAPTADCLANLLANGEHLIRVPLRRTPDGSPHLGTDTIRFNFTNPFAGLWAEVLALRHIGNENILLEGPTFEGPLIHRNISETVGLPDKGFFIFADDSDFFIRAARGGYQAELITSALLHRMLPFSMQKTATWKRYYEIRNIITLDKRYGTPSVRLLRPIFYAVKLLVASDSGGERRAVIKGFLHGIQGRLGRL